MNSFTDFIDVTRHLVAERYAAKDRVFAMGGSAGGLLVGAVANLSPGDYRGIVAQVPFVDVVTTMLDDSIPLTTNEYDEWGNPKMRADYDYMLSYSPYDNVRRASVSGHVRHDRPLGQPGAVLRTRQMDRQAARAQDRPATRCCCTSTWKPVTAASPAVSNAIARSRWNTPSCWTRRTFEQKKRRERGKLNRGARIDSRERKLKFMPPTPPSLRSRRPSRWSDPRSEYPGETSCGDPRGGSHPGVDSFERKLAVGAAYQQGRLGGCPEEPTMR